MIVTQLATPQLPAIRRNTPILVRSGIPRASETIRCLCSHRSTEHDGRGRCLACLCAQLSPVTLTAR